MPLRSRSPAVRRPSDQSVRQSYDPLLFLLQFVRHPLRVGAILPSSARLAKCMLDGIERRPGMRVAELGAGTGSFTAAIATWLPEDGAGLALEIDPVFVDRLIGRWPRIECVCERAEHLADVARTGGWGPFDHIVSGLPFASLPFDTTRRILYAVRRCLRDGGTFTTFQYVHGWRFPLAMRFRREAVRQLGSDQTSKLVLGNVPSAVVLRWRKPLATPAIGRDDIERFH